MKDEKLYIVHMVEVSERIFEYAKDGKVNFLSDTKTQDAVIRNFEILGEAAKRVPQRVKALSKDIPWNLLAGFRDILIHQYAGVDLEQVWIPRRAGFATSVRSSSNTLDPI